MDFKDFFNSHILLERKVWGANLLKGEKIINLLIKKILNGDLSLYSHNNTLTIQLPYCDLKIKLKAFNNYKSIHMHRAIGALHQGKDGNPIIEIYFFEILKEFRNYRGKSSEDLNNIMFNFIRKGYQKDKIFSSLQHELEHAFEHDRGIDLFEKDSGITDADSNDEQLKKYINQPHEINARVVQYIYKVNSKWSNDVKNKKWKDGHQDSKLDIENELSDIIASFSLMDKFTEDNRKKFIKGLYTTLVYLWHHYNRQANKA